MQGAEAVVRALVAGDGVQWVMEAGGPYSWVPQPFVDDQVHLAIW